MVHLGHVGHFGHVDHIGNFGLFFVNLFNASKPWSLFSLKTQICTKDDIILKIGSWPPSFNQWIHKLKLYWPNHDKHHGAGCMFIGYVWCTRQLLTIVLNIFLKCKTLSTSLKSDPQNRN